MNDELSSLPIVKSIDDVELIERTPLSDRALPKSTYASIAKMARAQPDECAIRYVQNGTVWRQDKEAGKDILSRDIRYSELLERIHQVANLLHQLGLGEDDVVSMVLPNIPEAYFVLFGGEAAGIVNPINYFLDASEIGEIIQSAGSKALVIMGEHPETDILSKLPTIRHHASCLEHVLVVNEGGELPAGCLDFYKELEQQERGALSFSRDVSPHDIASLFHTGGTTGLPKLARHSHQNEVYIGWALNILLRYKAKDTSLVGLPIFHCNAALASGLVSFMAGATVLLAGINGYRTPGIVQNLYHLVDHYKVVNFSAVPTIYAILVQQNMEGCSLESLRFPTCGAAPMPVELFNRFEQQTGIRISEGYGLTEATVCSTACPIESDPPRIGSIGIRLPYTQVKSAIVDSDGAFVRDCELNEIGSILISGPSMTPGYTDESRNASLFVEDNDGVKWVNTGDLARQDEDGFFWLTGRAKELIIRGGHNIDPKSIEEVLATHPAVNMVAAIGRPDSYAGEIPVAYVDLVSPVSESELLEYCQSHIGERAAVPKAVVILDRLPTTGVGKIHKPTLALREIETVVKRELSGLEDQLKSMIVEAKPDPKFGTIALVRIELHEHSRAPDVLAEIRKILGGFSFNYDLMSVDALEATE